MMHATSKGYTLIELLVSLSIFAIIMLAATSAYLSYIAYNRQAQTSASVMNALSFAVDSMTRDIRTGTGYSCDGSPNNCTSSGTMDISFTDENGCEITYDLNTTNNDIERSVVNQGDCVSTVESPESDVPLTESALDVTNLEFYSRGIGTGDNIQPIIVITVGGTATVPNSTTVIPFNIQMTAVERQLDL